MNIKVRDKRRQGFFIIDNEVLTDYDLSKYAFIFYCYLCLYERNEQAYLSKTMLSKHFDNSRNVWIKAEKELISKSLIFKAGKNAKNITIYDLLIVKKTVASDNSKSDRLLHETTGAVASDNINKTNIKTERKVKQTTPDIVKRIFKHWLNISCIKDELSKSKERDIITTVNKYSEEQLKIAIVNMCKDPWTIQKSAFSLNRLIKLDKRYENMNKFGIKPRRKPEPINIKSTSDEMAKAYAGSNK